MHPNTRKVTRLLSQLAEDGVIDWEDLATACLNWMSEADVAEMADKYEFIPDDEEESEEE